VAVMQLCELSTTVDCFQSHCWSHIYIQYVLRIHTEMHPIPLCISVLIFAHLLRYCRVYVYVHHTLKFITCTYLWHTDALLCIIFWLACHCNVKFVAFSLSDCMVSSLFIIWFSCIWQVILLCSIKYIDTWKLSKFLCMLYTCQSVCFIL